MPGPPSVLPRSGRARGEPHRPLSGRAAFDLRLPFELTGDQPKAVEELTVGLERGERWQTLMGVTGSGKTVTVANVIARWGRPALVLSHNKTLAAQLYGELKQFFPANAVEYWRVSQTCFKNFVLN